MDITYGKPVESVRRFTVFKWATAAVLLAFLLVAWLTGGGDDAGRGGTPGTVIEEAPRSGLATSGPAAQGASGQGGTGAGAAAKAPSFSIERTPDGGIRVSGTVANEMTRDQWLNAIRIGAQGTPVTGGLEVGDVATASDWAGQLSSLVAVMRENRLAAVQVEGDRVVLRGSVANEADKASAEQVMQAQLPPGYQLESRLAAAPATGGGTAAGGAASRRADAGTGGAGAAGAAAGGAAGGATAGPAATAGATGTPQASAAAGADRTPAKSPSKSISCPRRIRSLAQSVYFRTDSASLPSKDAARLERLGACLGRHSVRIIGHADPRHTDEYNLALSRRRAEAVAQALVAGGAPEARLTIVAAGSKTAADQRGSRAAMQRARRVDLIIR